MSEYFIWVCVFLLTLLDAAVKCQVSMRDKTQVFFDPNNNARYIVGTVPSRSEAAPESVRLSQLDADDDPPDISQLVFAPPTLDFKKCTFGTARSKKVLVQNTDRSKSIQLFSISGTTAHVHSSLFEDKVLQPLQNTSFHIVFVVRELGPFLSPLFIHTSEGTHKFMVKGIGIESAYRIQPINVKRLPLNGALKQPIAVHNPHPFPIVVMELVKNLDDLRLDLPTGRVQGSQSLWKISPYSTKTIMNAHFKASSISNYTGYIRVKTNQKENILFIPVDITVTATPGLYIPQDKLDFGYGCSMQDPSTFTLGVLNSARRVIKISKVELEQSTEAIKISFEPVKVLPNNTHSTFIATITVDWNNASKEKLSGGRIVLRSKGGHQLLMIPYSLNPQEGVLWYDKSSTTFWSGNEARNAMLIDFTVRNDYKNPLAISRVELQPVSPKQKTKALKLEPTVLSAGQKLSLMKLGKPATVKGMAFLTIFTNVTALNITLNSYDGKLHPIMLSLRPDEDLDLGLVGYGCFKEGFFALLNLNPLSIEILEWKISYEKADVQLLGIDKEKFSTTNLLARTSFADYDRSNIRIVEAGSYAVFRLRVEAPNHSENIFGNIVVLTEYEDIKIPFRMNVLSGSLEMVKDSLVLPDCFPGKHCFATVQVQSTFPALMLVESVVSVPHSSDLRFYFPQLKQNVAKSIINPSTTSSIGHLLWGGKDASEELIYVESYTDPANTPCMQLLALPSRTKDVDIGMLQRNWDRFRKLTNNGKEQWKNYTFLMDTSGVRNFPFEVKVRLIWPHLTNISDQIIKFPLTQVGNTSLATVEIINSASSAMLLHVVLEEDYPGAKDLLSGLPAELLPSRSNCSGRSSFGVKAQGVTSSEESSLLKEAGVHPNTLLVLLGPLQSTKVFVSFTPDESGTSSSMLIIRNSLTVLEVLMLTGKAAKPQFRFGNRLPGSVTPLTFDLPKKLLQECVKKPSPAQNSLKSDNNFVDTVNNDEVNNVDDDSNDDDDVDWDEAADDLYDVPFLTVKRLFIARNSGNLPITVSSILINGSPCEGNGFHIIDCQPFQLQPNEGRRIDIAHTPGFTFSRIRSLLEFHTSMGFPVNFTLESYVPPEYLRPCYAAMPRPRWEAFLLLSSTCMMMMLLVCVTVAAFLDTDRIMLSSFFNATNFQPLLDLNFLSDGVQTSNDDNEEEVEEMAKRHLTLEELSPIEMGYTSVSQPISGTSTFHNSTTASSHGSSSGPPHGFSQSNTNYQLRHSHGSTPTSQSYHQTQQNTHSHSPAQSVLPLHPHSHSQKGRSSWLAWLKGFFLPMLKEKSKGRNSFIAAAQAAVAQAAVSQAAEEVAKQIAASAIGINNVAIVQGGGKKKGAKRDQPHEEHQGRRGRQGKRRGGYGNQGGGGVSGGDGAGAGAGAGAGSGGGGNQAQRHSTASGNNGCPLHSRGTGSRRDRRQRKGVRCCCRYITNAAVVPHAEVIDQEGDVFHLEDPGPGDVPINEFDPDPDEASDTAGDSCDNVGEAVSKHSNLVPSGEQRKKAEPEMKVAAPGTQANNNTGLTHSQPLHGKGSRSVGKKGRGNQNGDGQNQQHNDHQYQHNQRQQNRSRGQQQGYDQQGRQHQGHDQLGRQQQGRQQQGHDQQGRQQQGHDQQGRQQQGHDQQGRQQQGHDQQGRQQQGNQRQQHHNQGSKKQGSRHPSRDNGHVRVDSMTVRNRNTWKHGKLSGNISSTVMENKRSSISDSGESCALELPYKMRSSENSGKKSPASSLNTQSISKDSHQSSFSSKYLHEPPPSCPPPPTRLWETSFSEVVSRGDSSYSTVARLGGKGSNPSGASKKAENFAASASQIDQVKKPAMVASESRMLALLPYGMKENMFKPHDGASQSNSCSFGSPLELGEPRRKELGPIGPRKKPTTAVINPWTENVSSSLQVQPASSPDITSMSSICNRENHRDQFDSFPNSPLDTIKEDQFVGFQLDRQLSPVMVDEYQVDQQPSSYESSYEHYHTPNGHYRGSRMQQPLSQLESRPPLYVGPSSYNLNRVMDHQHDHSMEHGVDLTQGNCSEEHGDEEFDEEYDESYDPSYEQQYDSEGIKHHSSHHQHHLDMLVQQYQQQSLHSHPSYSQVHQMQIQQPSAGVTQHVYQQQTAGQALVLVNGQRNVSTEKMIGDSGMMPYMWLDQQAAQAQQQMPIPHPQQMPQPQTHQQLDQMNQIAQPVAHHLSRQVQHHSLKPIPMPPQYAPQQQAPSLAQQMQQYHLQQQGQQQRIQQSQQHIQQLPHHLQVQQQITQQQKQQQLHVVEEERVDVLQDDHQTLHYREAWQRVGSAWENRPQSSGGNTSAVASSAPLQNGEVKNSDRDSTNQIQSPTGNCSVWGAVGEAWASSDVSSSASKRSSTTTSTISSTTSTSTSTSTSSNSSLTTTSSSIWSSDPLSGISRPYARSRPASDARSNSQHPEENTFDPFRSRTISNIWSSKGSGK